MTKKTDGGPAFPNPSGDDRDNNGMTLRDFLAAAAMVGFIATENTEDQFPYYDRVAEQSYKCADEMLKARAQ